MRVYNVIFLAFVLALLACNNGQPAQQSTDTNTVAAITPAIPFTAINVYPHDNNAYTQGLYFENGYLMEGTGLEGKSKLRKVDIKTGKVLQETAIAKNLFGEGIAPFKGNIYQLTWQNKKVLVYDAKSLQLKEELYSNREGWGLTTNGTSLIQSDGSSNLYFIDPFGWKTLKIVGVTDGNGPVGNLNELEYIDGFVFANVYLTDDILKINAENGQVVGKMNLSDLTFQSKQTSPNQDVLNGIAWDSTSRKLYVTGKLWSKLFEIKFN